MKEDKSKVSLLYISAGKSCEVSLVDNGIKIIEYLNSSVVIL